MVDPIVYRPTNLSIYYVVLFFPFPALRIDAKAHSLKETLDEKKGELPPSSGDHDNTIADETTASKVVMNFILFSKDINMNHV